MRAQPVEGHEVREDLLAVDLDDGQLLTVSRLEPRVATDVHEGQLEAKIGLGGFHDLERTIAEMTTVRVIHDDPGHRRLEPHSSPRDAGRVEPGPYDRTSNRAARGEDHGDRYG